MNRYKRRLLNVAVALRDAAKVPEAVEIFTMRRYAAPADKPAHDALNLPPDCGTPCCALGHYAVRRDLQRTFFVVRSGVLFCKNRESLTPELFMEHFGISGQELDTLFTVDGCDRAKTPLAAAKFIERFAERKWPTK